MIVLGIESTAHTFGVAVIRNKNILSNVKRVYITKQGGMVPLDVAKHHEAVKYEVLDEALKKAHINPQEIDLISFSQGPGLPPCLLVGKAFALELAKQLKKPLVGVNHICAHLAIGTLLTKAKDPIFVFTSGANTQIIAYEGGRFRVFGECLSIAIGNALDKFGREIGLGFPAGPKIEKLAKKGHFIELPYNVKGMDVDFSGLVTKAVSLYKKGYRKEDLCFSLQETCFAMLTEVTERALAHCEKSEVLLIGGVAANKRLCEMLNDMCNARNAAFYVVPLEYAGDQAAMIAWQGLLQYRVNRKASVDIDIKPRWRIDSVEVTWIR